MKTKKTIRYKRKELSIGKYAAALGFALCAIRLTGLYFGAEILRNRWLYVAMLCLVCGGLAVLSYEKKGKASLFSVLSLAAYLVSTLLGNMSGGGDILSVTSGVLLLFSFLFSAFIVIKCANGNPLLNIGAAAAFIVALVSFINSLGVSFAPVLSLLLLVLKYLLTAILFLYI